MSDRESPSASAPSSNDDEALTLQMRGVDGEQADRQAEGPRAPRRRRIENPGEWDREAAIRAIQKDHQEINRVTGMNDPLTSALVHERLKLDKMEHSARQTAYLSEKARQDEEDAKQLKEDERERAKGHENIMGAPFANSVNKDDCCPVVGGLYFPYIHVTNPNVPKKEKIALWRKTLTGIVNGICPALSSAYNEKAEGRVLYNKVLLDTLYLTGPDIFDHMIEDPTTERRETADVFYLTR